MILVTMHVIFYSHNVIFDSHNAYASLGYLDVSPLLGPRANYTVQYMYSM